MDVEKLRKRIANSVSRGIASGALYSEIARNIRIDGKISVGRSMTIARTEGNRVYSEASLDSGMRAKENTGADLIKQWDSTLDSKTRPHHRQLDGQVRELDEDFEVGNMKASAPLHFGAAEEDINCRCVALIKPRWDVDTAFTKRDNQSGELLEFKGVSDYENFKKRYWESVDKSQKNGIMKVDETIGRSVGAAGKNYPVKLPNGNHAKFAEGSTITKIKVFAGKGTNKPIKNVVFLENEYGISADKWQKVRGEGTIVYNGQNRTAEVHWYEAENQKYKVKVKRWLDES